MWVLTRQGHLCNVEKGEWSLVVRRRGCLDTGPTQKRVREREKGRCGICMCVCVYVYRYVWGSLRERYGENGVDMCVCGCVCVCLG